MPIDPTYNTVPERLAEFKAKHPEGSFQPVNKARPYWVETIGEKTFIVYAAAAYRTPDDQKPGIGLAWEPFPGPTNFTRDSELQNAETSAWGRAMIAVLAADAKKGVATQEDIQRREADQIAIRAHTARVKLLRDEVKRLGLTEQVKELELAWPWSEAACAQVEQLVEAYTAEQPAEPGTLV
jgi:hypothetical protein